MACPRTQTPSASSAAAHRPSLHLQSSVTAPHMMLIALSINALTPASIVGPHVRLTALKCMHYVIPPTQLASACLTTHKLFHAKNSFFIPSEHRIKIDDYHSLEWILIFYNYSVFDSSSFC